MGDGKRAREGRSRSAMEGSSLRVFRAYRGLLKLQLNWVVSKVRWYDMIPEVRASFEKHLAAGGAEAERFLAAVEKDLRTFKHPDPYKFPFYEYKDEHGIVEGTGTKFQRNTPPPDFVTDDAAYDRR